MRRKMEQLLRSTTGNVVSRDVGKHMGDHTWKSITAGDNSLRIPSCIVARGCIWSSPFSSAKASTCICVHISPDACDRVEDEDHLDCSIIVPATHATWQYISAECL